MSHADRKSSSAYATQRSENPLVTCGKDARSEAHTASPTPPWRPRRRARLSLSFAAKACIRLRDAAGHRYELPTGRTVRYVLVRNTGPTRTARPFLIDSWTVTVSVSRPKAAAPAG